MGLPFGLIERYDMGVDDPIEDALQRRDVRIAGERTADLEIADEGSAFERRDVGRAFVQEHCDQNSCGADGPAKVRAANFEIP